MDADEHGRRSASFGAVAGAYAEHRPEYPAEAVAWLVGDRRGRILELGAGTGKLTRSLAGLGHDVVATDPLPAMLAKLPRPSPVARVVARAEQIPLETSTFDVVVCAQAFDWFDHDRALPEIARVVKPGGVLALVWNTADAKVPWVRKVLSLINGLDDDLPEDPLEGSDLFTTQESKVFRHWQRFDRPSLIGFVSSHSYAAVMSAADREALLAEVGAVYDSYGRGPHGMMMPWQARCFRATVSRLTVQHDQAPPDDGLLIDFA